MPVIFSHIGAHEVYVLTDPGDLYFARLTAGSSTATQKLLLVK